MKFYYVRNSYADIDMPATQRVATEFRQTHDLNERTKELKCLYGVFRLFNAADLALDRTLQKVVDLIPNGWQFPEIACARLTIGKAEYRSKCYKTSEWKLSASIVVNKEIVGILEIAYTECRPECFKDLFLEEEVFLLEAIASLIGQSIRQKELEEERIRLFREIQMNYEKILRGFIPICASCKKIRDQDGMWQDMETYVQTRTEAKFSHGICPACAIKLYPHLSPDNFR